jgi:hypothetical protein
VAALLEDPILAARMREKALAWAAGHDWEAAFAATRDALLETWRDA